MRKLGKKGAPENSGKSLMRRRFAAKSNKENGIVATWERGFESLHPDHSLSAFTGSHASYEHRKRGAPVWDFGALSTLLGGLKFVDRAQMASRYGLTRPDLLTAFTRNLNNVRDICAHHGRLWNRSPADRLALSRPGEAALLEHLCGDVDAQSRIYATAVFLQHLLRTINPASSWGSLESILEVLSGRRSLSVTLDFPAIGKSSTFGNEVR
jgi:hypothetical protein